MPIQAVAVGHEPSDQTFRFFHSIILNVENWSMLCQHRLCTLQYVSLHPFDIDFYEMARDETVRVERVERYRLAAFAFAQCHAAKISSAGVIYDWDRDRA